MSSTALREIYNNNDIIRTHSIEKQTDYELLFIETKSTYDIVSIWHILGEDTFKIEESFVKGADPFIVITSVIDKLQKSFEQYQQDLVKDINSFEHDIHSLRDNVTSMSRFVIRVANNQ